MLCPRCQVPLTDFHHDGLRTSMCPTCRGLFFRRADLLAADPELLGVVQQAPQAPAKALACPFDQEPMVARAIQTDHSTVVVDHCPCCEGLWLDQGELAALRKAVKRARRTSDRARSLRPRYRGDPNQQAQKVLDAQQRRLNTNSDGAVAKTTTGWAVFAVLSDLPVEGYNPVYRSPVVTYALMAICVLVFLAQLAIEPLTMALAMVPDHIFQHPYTPFTAIFLHADIIHLLVNLYFLKICGDNVEDRLGPRWYLLLFLSSGVLGSLAHGLLTTSTGIPMLGASGAVSGILAAYVCFFPDVRLSLLPLWWVIFRGASWIHLRALFFVPIWFLLQVAMLFLGVQGVAVWAHIGGFLGGLGLSWWLAQHTPDARIATLAARIASGEHVPDSD